MSKILLLNYLPLIAAIKNMKFYGQTEYLHKDLFSCRSPKCALSLPSKHADFRCLKILRSPKKFRSPKYIF